MYSDQGSSRLNKLLRGRKGVRLWPAMERRAGGSGATLQ